MFLMTYAGIVETVIDENHFWDSSELGVNSPEALLFTLVYYNLKFFNLRVSEIHRLLLQSLDPVLDSINAIIKCVVTRPGRSMSPSHLKNSSWAQKLDIIISGTNI